MTVRVAMDLLRDKALEPVKVVQLQLLGTPGPIMEAELIIEPEEEELLVELVEGESLND